MVLGTQRERTRRLTDTLARPFVWLRIPPNALTVVTLVPALAAAWLVWHHDWFLALAVGVLTACIDFLDGAVARATDRVSRFGGFLDSLIDRYVDGLFLFALGLALDRTLGWIAVAAALIGTYGISYARARALQAEPAIPAETWNQVMERPERLIMLGLGVFGQGMAEAFGYGWDVLFWTVVVYAAATNATVLQRALKARPWLAEKG
jgi:phosphatidylglycerophosphate synthase